MTMRCKVCSHDKREVIEKEVLRGVPHLRIGKKYGMSDLSVRNHAMNRLSKELVKAKEIKDLLHSETIVNEITFLYNKCRKILKKAGKKGSLDTSLKAIAQARDTIELLCKLSAYASRGQELEAQGSREIDKEKLKRLSIDELVLFQRLLSKYNGGSEDEIIETKGTAINRN